MVNFLSHHDHGFLNEALKKAEAKTSARISAIVRPASTSYQAYILTYGLTFGSAAAMALWQLQIVETYPWLLLVQLGVTAAFDLAYTIGGWFVRLVPRKTRHHYAAQEAMRAYHTLHAHLPKEMPFVLLFVSEVERYVHVVTNNVVYRQIPDDWHKVTDAFTQSIKPRGVRASCVTAIDSIADILSVHFPV